MPTTLSTTVRHIYDKVPNSVNSKLIEDFHHYMKYDGTSPRHHNNNLKAMISFAVFLGPDRTFLQINSRNQISCFLDTKTKPDSLDPERRWITTWNDYLVRIKHFFRWLYNHNNKSDNRIAAENPSSSSADWDTPEFVNIKTKRIKRLSPYGESFGIGNPQAFISISLVIP
jgi:hypothetical protein